jgi:hypothetical protein
MAAVTTVTVNITVNGKPASEELAKILEQLDRLKQSPTHINISTAEQVNAEVQRGIKEAAPHIIAASIAACRDAERRRPNSNFRRSLRELDEF